MTNTFLTPQGIVRRALIELTNNLVFTKHCFKGYGSNHFGNANPKEGDTLSIKLPQKFVTKSTNVFEAQDIVARWTNMTLDIREHVGVEFADTELTLDVDSFAEAYTNGAMLAIKNRIDFLGLGQYKNVYNQVGTPGSTPSSLSVIGDAGEVLDNNGVPRGANRVAIMDAKATNKIVTAMGSLYNPTQTVSSQYRSGVLEGVGLGFQWKMDQNVNRHTTGNFGDGEPTAQVTAFSVNQSIKNMNNKNKTEAVTVNPQTITASGFSNDAISPFPSLKHGDVFTISGVYAVNHLNWQSTGELQQMVCSADCAWDSDHITISFEPELNATVGDPNQNVTALPDPVTNKDIIVAGAANTAYPVNLLFHESAFAFVSPRLEIPNGSVFASSETLDGISIRLWKDNDFINSAFPARMDILAGFKTVRPEMAVRLIG